MCGIAGYAAGHGPQVLEAMLDLIAHRGPDDRGSSHPSDGVRLGMTRLAIIDLKTGRQPMSDASGDVTVVFNGEIYNYIELRRSFEAQGRVFATQSDTETILHAYQVYGEDFAHQLNGMFAIAIWDRRLRKLVLTRDRFGVKPLFYSQLGSELAFASEIKALKPFPGICWEQDRHALSNYLSLRHIPAPWTAYQGVRAMEPGEQMVWESGRTRRRRWYQLPVPAPSDVVLDENRLIDELDGLLRDSVRIRMRSDVSYGAYLSGGIDSSTVTAIMSEFSSKPVKTFSLAYRDTPAHKKDALYARQIAERYGTEHREWAMDWPDFKSDFSTVMDQLDQPFAGVIASYWLSRHMAGFVKTALSGDGADDVFGSYGHHRLVWPLEALKKAKAEGRVPADEDFGFFKDRKDFVRSFEGLEPWQWRLGYAAFLDSERDALLTPRGRDYFGAATGSDYLKDLYLQTDAGIDPLNRLLALDVKTLLPNEILYFNDLLSMAHSLEVRTPFLDYRIVEFAFRLPGTLKIRNGILKYLLRKTAARYLPAEVLERPKEGFVLPNNTWFRGPMSAVLKERLSPDRLKKDGFFDPAYVDRLVGDFMAGDDAVTFKLYTLYVFEHWREMWR